MAKPRVVIADDHQLLLDGIQKILEPEFDVVETVRDGRAAVDAFDRLRPDVLLLDVGLPLLNGIEAARQVKRMAPAARILFVTVHPDRVYVEEALRAGGSGYVLKQATARELVDAIRTVLQGRVYVSPGVASGGAAKAAQNSTSLWSGHLTPRQREVLQLVAEGKSMKGIAAILGISVRTVEFHKNGIMQQLGFRSTAELTRYALDHGIAIGERPKRRGGAG
jgi:DNA-binding NarL/FixJ family response regulator